MATGHFAFASNTNRFLACAPLADHPFAILGRRLLRIEVHGGEAGDGGNRRGVMPERHAEHLVQVGGGIGRDE